MKAMILAAGRGERLGSFTLHKPKALFEINGKSLIHYQIEKCVASGISDIVINYAYKGQQIVDAIGNDHAFGATINYSKEIGYGLETGGGVVKALPLLGVDPFLLVNVDVISDVDYRQLPDPISGLAHLILLPRHIAKKPGDFDLHGDCVVSSNQPNYTFSGISVLHPDLFAGYQVGRYRLRPILEKAITQRKVTASQHHGHWCNINSLADIP